MELAEEPAGGKTERREKHGAEVTLPPPSPREAAWELQQPGAGTEPWGSLVVQLGKNLPAVQETLVRALSQENALEKEMATHSSYSCLEKSHGQRNLAGCNPTRLSN